MSVRRLVDGAAYAATYWGAVGAFTLGWGFRAVGRHHLPRTGPVLLAANHQSFFDPVLVGAAAPRRLAYLARSTLFTNPLFSRLIRHFGAVPIDRGFGKDGLRAVLGELDAGRAVLLFPEGERTHDGRLQPLKPGVALLVKRVTCPIVPCGIAGAFAAWPRRAKWPTPAPLGRGTIAVAFGEPLDPARLAGLGRDEVLAELGAAVGRAQAAAERLRS